MAISCSWSVFTSFVAFHVTLFLSLSLLLQPWPGFLTTLNANAALLYSSEMDAQSSAADHDRQTSDFSVLCSSSPTLDELDKDEELQKDKIIAAKPLAAHGVSICYFECTSRSFRSGEVMISNQKQFIFIFIIHMSMLFQLNYDNRIVTSESSCW